MTFLKSVASAALIIIALMLVVAIGAFQALIRATGEALLFTDKLITSSLDSAINRVLNDE